MTHKIGAGEASHQRETRELKSPAMPQGKLTPPSIRLILDAELEGGRTCYLKTMQKKI